MIAHPLTRRAVMACGLVGTAALSGCSVSDATTRKVEDPEAADRARLTQARDLSANLQREIESMSVASPTLTTLRALHVEQIAQFARSAGVSPPPRPTPETPTPLTVRQLPGRERALAQALRALALHAQRGDVAALLASAAAGIDQALTR